MNTVLDQPKASHRVEVVPVELLPHPNADKLSIVQVYGFQCVVATDQWRGVTKAAYLQPDSMVDTALPEFAFLAPQAKADGYAIIKAKKLRGVVSFGCLFPVPEDCEIGDEVSDRFAVTHYEPPLQVAKVAGPKGVNIEETEVGPAVPAPCYDLDPLQRYPHLIPDGTPVYVTEKMDGANCRYVFHEGRFWCGSRNQWKREFPEKPEPDKVRRGLEEAGRTPEQIETILASIEKRVLGRNAWWQALHETPTLMGFLESHPGVVVYLELAGSTNILKYGFDKNKLFAFDVYENGRFWDAEKSLGEFRTWGIPTAPLLTPEPIPYDFDTIKEMAEGHSLTTDKVIREGVVVVPAREIIDARIGRVKLKMVSGSFLEKYRK